MSSSSKCALTRLFISRSYKMATSKRLKKTVPILAGSLPTSAAPDVVFDSETLQLSTSHLVLELTTLRRPTI